MKRKVSMIMALISIASLTGCGNAAIANVPLQNGLTYQELTDYYAKSMQYKIAVEHGKGLEHSTYSLRDVSETVEGELIKATDKVESDLQKPVWSDTMYVPEQIHQYMKVMLDDKVLTRWSKGDEEEYNKRKLQEWEQSRKDYLDSLNMELSERDGVKYVTLFDKDADGNVIGQTEVEVEKLNNESLKKYLNREYVYKPAIQVEESQGHYFVTVRYKVAPQGIATIGDNAKYIGIHGAFTQDLYGNITMDMDFVNWIDDCVKVYESGDEKVAEHITDTKVLDRIKKERAQNVKNSLGGNEHSELYIKDIDENLRAPEIDVSLVNKLLGASENQTAILPALTSVVHPATSGGLGGYGIYPEANATLNKYGITRDNVKGDATLRFVFKRGLVDSTKLEFKNVYMVDCELDSLDDSIREYKKNNDKENMSGAVVDTVVDAIKTVIESGDRCISNNDLAGLSNGKVFADMGVAILSGLSNKYCYLEMYTTDVKEVIDRDLENKSYLVKISTAKRFGPKGGEDYGCYEMGGYAVVNQLGSDFIITDMIFNDIKMTREPQINADDTLMKRFASLANADAVPQDEDDKEDILQLLQSLYDKSNNRDPQAMYELLDKDTVLLSSSRRDYLLDQLINRLMAKGTDIDFNYSGNLSDWIGATNEQAEFVTQELIDYGKANCGLYMQNYYLVSKYGDGWVIDDIKLIEQKEVGSEEMAQIKESIEKNQSFNVKGATLSQESNVIVSEIQKEEAVASEVTDMTADEYYAKKSVKDSAKSEDSTTGEG